MSPERLLNVQQVADFLQLKATTVYTWAKSGKLPAIRLGRNWRFRQSDLEAWLDKNSQGNELDDSALSNTIATES